MTSDSRRGALRAWLLVRTALATAVLGLAYALFSPDTELQQNATTVIMESIVGLSIASSFAVAAYVERGGRERVAGGTLLVLDITLISASVVVTGGAASVLAVLYGAVIVAAATALGGRAAFLAGGLSLAAYGSVALGLWLSALSPPTDQLEHYFRLDANELAFSVLSNIAAMTTVAFLSNWLAVELDRTGGALAVSESDRERLAIRNDAIVRSIGTGLITIGHSLRITSSNESALEILQAGADEMIGHDVHEFFPSFDAAANRIESRAETMARRLDGSRFPAGFALTMLRGTPNDEDETLLTFQDLTEIRRLEAAARDAEQLATLGRVAATLAHEIRNPLGAISGSVELVRENPVLPDEDKNLLSIVVREVERIDQLVRDMLDVARRREPRFEVADLASLCREIATIAPRTSDETKRVVVTAPETFSAVFDADMIRQVVWNLVKNAMQASPATGRVSLSLDSREDGGFELVVEDDGPGIPEDELERIFDAFHTRKSRGIGLGLALVRQIVSMHHGAIDASNRPERGARFRMRIPELTPSGASDPDFVSGSNPDAKDVSQV